MIVIKPKSHQDILREVNLGKFIHGKIYLKKREVMEFTLIQSRGVHLISPLKLDKGGYACKEATFEI